MLMNVLTTLTLVTKMQIVLTLLVPIHVDVVLVTMEMVTLAQVKRSLIITYVSL